ncbi:MAG TPA: FAA hydrolase family protein [Gemmatimonadetes bacterium]|jgi:2-keto-4-pentenoate hydratase/2-oxohepta-3-ene-1,7-dioic acid hydratase in catechol pathway|nr:FAA hydrolase family protein [Gemmatimonadota bacterium]HIB09008.1 FAA hydrolase family protein [Gemmatimonadota bacterium]HIC14550.1 FAA hydrolase family protein [Gemmatimonadota bacterium]HIN77813.1 FAA hydrolase family protein [Gemmatimonadota bacterium]
MTEATPTKLVCVGRNYAKHAVELGGVVPDEPLIFFKPPSSIVRTGEPIVIPDGVGRVDFEGEIAVVIGETARNVEAKNAWNVVQGIAPLNDVTARDLQRIDDQWGRAKGFDTFCPVGEMVHIAEIDLSNLTVLTRVNGEVRQQGNVQDLVFSIPTLIEYISGIMTLQVGDLIATGTPEGVGPLYAGDTVEVEVGGVGTLSNPVVGEN